MEEKEKVIARGRRVCWGELTPSGNSSRCSPLSEGEMENIKGRGEGGIDLTDLSISRIASFLIICSPPNPESQFWIDPKWQFEIFKISLRIWSFASSLSCNLTRCVELIYRRMVRFFFFFYLKFFRNSRSSESKSWQ